MNHQPFEDWLLNDDRLTAGEEWELNLHLRGCAECARLAQANHALRAAPISAPSVGFVLRFQEKLIAERKAKRIRNILGLTLILVVGLGVILLLVPAYMNEISTSPTQLAVTWSTRLVYIGLTLRSIAQTGNLFADVATFVPSYVWLLSLTALIGSGFLWLFSSRRFTRFLEARGRNRQSATFDNRR
jgi:hypothetical protein